MKFSLISGLLFAGLGSLHAVQTEKFLNDTFSDFSEGEARGVAVTTDGFLQIGPSMEKWVSLPVSVVWAAIRDAKGRIFVAAGNEGQVFRVGSDGKTAEFFKSKELQVQALALDPSGNLYAATIPDGKVYRIDADGKSSLFFDPKEKYIWALQFDPEGNLFVATGESGKLYKVSPSGKGIVFYDSDETHLRTLILDRQKRLWVGSEGNGLVYRFDSIAENTGRPFVAYDSNFREIKAMVASPDGSIFVAAMGDGKAPHSPPPSAPKLSLSSGNAAAALQTALAGIDLNPKTEEVAFPPSQPEKPGAGEIIRIGSTGNIEKWWSDSEDVYCLARLEDGRIWAGTGKKGKLIEITGPKQFSILGQVEAETITTLISHHKTWLATTSNGGALWTISLAPGRKGIFESRVFDGRFSSRWGVLDWSATPGSTCVNVETRSGNTSKPDKVWSDWTPRGKDRRAQSPVARFIQYRLILESSPKTNPSDSVDNVTLYYQPDNQSPRIARILLISPNIELAKTPKLDTPLPPISPNFGSNSAPGRGSKTSESNEEMYAAWGRSPLLQQVKKWGWRSLLWQASDPNGDELEYDLLYRSSGSNQWQPLEKQVREPFFSWDAATWPDGDYYLKVVAGDQISNLENQALTDEMTSDIFTVDNTAPSIQIDLSPETLKKGYAAITIQDATSIVDEAEFSVDGEDWRPLLPIHGLYDAKTNDFRIPTAHLKPGPHYVVIRASDSTGNVASQTAPFRKP